VGAVWMRRLAATVYESTVMEQTVAVIPSVVQGGGGGGGWGGGWGITTAL
jgi:hypothetical protein